MAEKIKLKNGAVIILGKPGRDPDCALASSCLAAAALIKEGKSYIQEISCQICPHKGKFPFEIDVYASSNALLFSGGTGRRIGGPVFNDRT